MGVVVTTMVALMITAVSAMMLEVAQAEAAAEMTDSEATDRHEHAFGVTDS